MVKVRVPATTANLGPGFDCLGMAVAIYNEITIDRAESASVEITASGSAATSDISLDSSNLVYRAAAHVLKLAGQNPSGIRLNLNINAPLARGLGSSASAIAGGMFAANEFAGNPLTLADLARETTRMEGHPDNVVPCLVGGLTSSLCLGEEVLYQQVQPAASIRCVFFIPDYELETAKARGVMPAEVSMADAVFNSSRIPFVLSHLSTGNLENLRMIMDDRLHQPYRIPLIRGYEDVREAALTAGAAAVCISGAGPTILAVCNTETAPAVAVAGKAALEAAGVQVDCRIVETDPNGCRREE